MLPEISQSGANRASSLLASSTVSLRTTPQSGTLCMSGIQVCTITALRSMYRMYRIQEVDHVWKRSMKPHLSLLVLLQTPCFLIRNLYSRTSTGPSGCSQIMRRSSPGLVNEESRHPSAIPALVAPNHHHTSCCSFKSCSNKVFLGHCAAVE